LGVGSSRAESFPHIRTVAQTPARGSVDPLKDAMTESDS
jgi:hypothetical protein